MMKPLIEIEYTMQGDYLLPNLELPEQPEVELNMWGRMRRKYLKEHRPIAYYNLLTDCALMAHLKDVQERAEELEDRLTEQMKKQEGITEQLKADDMMEWVRRMNNLQNRVREIVREEIIFAR